MELDQNGHLNRLWVSSIDSSQHRAMADKIYPTSDGKFGDWKFQSNEPRNKLCRSNHVSKCRQIAVTYI